MDFSTTQKRIPLKRIVLDFICLNKYIVNPSFKMTGNSENFMKIQKNVWMVSLDFEYTYLDVPLNP